MIHTANEYVSKHHRYLLSGVTIGLKNLDGKTGAAEDADKGMQQSFSTSAPRQSLSPMRSASLQLLPHCNQDCEINIIVGLRS